MSNLEAKIVEVNNLKKYYGQVKAVDDISFYVEKGKLFAFLGPNGAGKSTTIDVICTLLKPDSGEIIIDGHKLGHDDNSIRGAIGVVFQDGVLDPLLTVSENIKLRGKFYGLAKDQLKEAFEKVVNATEIGDFMNRPYGKLSGGQRRRADIARALINTPKILFLDEPTTGLDPQTRKKVWETILKMQHDYDMTIFLTTHYMEEASEADYVIVIDNGKIAAKGTPIELKNKYAHDMLKIEPIDIETLKKVLNEKNISYSIEHKLVMIKISSTIDSLPLLDICRPYIHSFEVLAGTMDDAFIGITGKEIRE